MHHEHRGVIDRRLQGRQPGSQRIGQKLAIGLLSATLVATSALPALAIDAGHERGSGSYRQGHDISLAAKGGKGHHGGKHGKHGKRCKHAKHGKRCKHSKVQSPGTSGGGDASGPVDGPVGDGSNTPAPQGGGNTPAPQDGNTTPGPQDGGTTPAPQIVTKTFANVDPIAVPVVGAPEGFGIANPYPSPITVSGFGQATITDLNLTLNDFSHTFPTDVSVLLVAPDGAHALVMADVGFVPGTGDEAVTDITLTLDDEADQPLPVAALLTTGAFQPRDGDAPGPDGQFPFPAPAPALNGNTALATFDGRTPDGEWQLFIIDDESDDTGEFAGGWSLEITAQT